MIRLKPEQLLEGMTIVDPITDEDGIVLLDSKSKLTDKLINVLKMWDVELVRVYEKDDTDESVARQLMLEKKEKRKDQPRASLQEKSRWAKSELGIELKNINSILKGKNKPGEIPTPEEGRVVTQAELNKYGDFFDKMNQILQSCGKNEALDARTISEFARSLARFVVDVPGAIAYTLQSDVGDDNNEPLKKLARHLLDTAIIAGKIGFLMKFNWVELSNVILGALLHDIGKAKLPQNMINQVIPSKTTAQWRLYTGHVSLGVAMIQKTTLPREVSLAVAQHHEKLDGSGFPMGADGEKIHLYARIVAIANYFDHMNHPGQPKAGFSLFSMAKQMVLPIQEYDIGIWTVFREYIWDFIYNNHVQLTDGRIGQVVYLHYSFPEPVVRTEDGELLDMNKSEARIDGCVV